MLKRVFGKTPSIAAVFGVALALVLTGCDSGGGSSGSGGALGDTPVLSGPVNLATVTAHPTNPYAVPSISFARYEGPALTVLASGGLGTGTISATGQLSVQLAPIDNTHLLPIDVELEYLLSYWSNVDGESTITISPATGIQAHVLYFHISGPAENEFLDDEVVRGTISLSGDLFTGMNVSIQSVEYIYVNNDVTITAGAVEMEDENDRFRANRFTIALRAGWNAIHFTHSMSGSLVAGVTQTVSAALRDQPNMQWLIGNIDLSGDYECTCEECECDDEYWCGGDDC